MTTDEGTAAPTADAPTAHQSDESIDAAAEPVEPLGDCPDGNTVSEVSSDMPAYVASGDIAFAEVKSAVAVSRKNGSRIDVYLSNTAFEPDEMKGTMMTPVRNAGEAIVVVKFSNADQKVLPGEYDPAAGYGKPMWVNADIEVKGEGDNGTMVGVGASEGTARILDMRDGNICGTFELSGGRSQIAGEFNVPLIEE
jgi:hypothetical protein